MKRTLSEQLAPQKKKKLTKETLSIPDDQWCSIMEYLDSSFVLNVCVFVCADWYRIVKERVPLSLSFSTKDRVRADPSAYSGLSGLLSERGCPFNTGRLSIYASRLNPLLVSLANIKESCRLSELSLWSCSIEEGGDLGRFPRLDTIRLTECLVYGGFIASMSQLQHLRRLELCYTLIPIEEMKNNKTLEHLSISFVTLSSQSIGAISTMSGLKTLKLAVNPLCDQDVKDISRLTNLTSLELSSGRVTEKGVSYLTSLGKLKRLSLNRGVVGQAGMRNIVKIKSLRELDLCGCGLDEESFSLDGSAKLCDLLPDLVHLGLRDNSIKGSSLLAISSMTQLTSLDLSRGCLGTLQLEQLKVLTNLTHLDVSYNMIASPALEHVSAMKKLTHLNLSHNSIDSSDLNRIIAMRDLVSLDLSGNVDILSRMSPGISVMYWLTDLNVSSTMPNSQAVKMISSLYNLTRLDISMNQVADGDMSHILSLPKLKNLVLGDFDKTEVHDPSEPIGREADCSASLLHIHLSNNGKVLYPLIEQHFSGGDRPISITGDIPYAKRFTHCD